MQIKKFFEYLPSLIIFTILTLFWILKRRKRLSLYKSQEENRVELLLDLLIDSLGGSLIGSGLGSLYGYTLLSGRLLESSQPNLLSNFFFIFHIGWIVGGVLAGGFIYLLIKRRNLLTKGFLVVFTGMIFGVFAPIIYGIYLFLSYL
jgi:hypothetical protein